MDAIIKGIVDETASGIKSLICIGVGLLVTALGIMAVAGYIVSSQNSRLARFEQLKQENEDLKVRLYKANKQTDEAYKLLNSNFRVVTIKVSEDDAKMLEAGK